jgi:hypothetical protein
MIDCGSKSTYQHLFSGIFDGPKVYCIKTNCSRHAARFAISSSNKGKAKVEASLRQRLESILPGIPACLFRRANNKAKRKRKMGKARDGKSGRRKKWKLERGSKNWIVVVQLLWNRPQAPSSGGSFLPGGRLTCTLERQRRPDIGCFGELVPNSFYPRR